LADRFALFGYGPVVRRKPFGPHLTVGALSCVVDLVRQARRAEVVNDP
jgi:hypothetical protein